MQERYFLLAKRVRKLSGLLFDMFLYRLDHRPAEISQRDKMAPLYGTDAFC
jgi:hypothetical protein